MDTTTGFSVIVLVLAGFIAGVMNSIAGGGTLVTFPALIFVGLPSIAANATSTIALLPAALSSAAGYRRNIGPVYRWLRIFAPVSLCGGLLGGILLVRTPSDVFDRLVPFLILFATILFTLQGAFSRVLNRHLSARVGVRREKTWIIGAALFQLAVALYGGYFGAGIGILMLASLGMLGFENVHEMNTLKVMMGFLINVVAAAYFISHGLIHWANALIMMAGTIAGGYAGAHFAQRIPQVRVRLLITVIGFVISAIMFYRNVL